MDNIRAMRRIDIGLSVETRRDVCDLLNRTLADSYLLQIKTKKYHWDVIGPQFKSLHQLLEQQYQMLEESIDDIAERARALGGYPVGTAEEFLKHTSIKEHPGDVPNATEMISRLEYDQEQIIRNLREFIDLCDDKYNDKGTADFFTDLIRAHEEMAWMLRSFIEGDAIEPDHELVGNDTAAVPSQQPATAGKSK